MLTKIDKHSGVPAYLQIMNQIKKEIFLGRFTDGSQLPPVREMENIFGVNMNTIMRALEYLQFEKIVEAKHGIGYFITSDVIIDPDIPKQIMEFVRDIKTKKIDLQMLGLLIEEVWKEC
ncbi:MAG TPA: GntR family transcriptional regulator [Petrotogaceae bacterium]|jgi:GntR family transcriptional regulator|nr:GntR family transcriptional regulator [Petrotogaceae bacterium]HOT30626.1 GntR family transcriptional regulator [Petrotogaceae bacterium]HPA92780.1 GntR family transcriptional regulator [Petrotogaceae bacterium]HPO26845.1 GntR family transcriptional regulator [Petrotogaceae bacterium]HPX15432.1 GntR family transcriptional regulator [Petrotogaceae bacterium]